MSSNFKHYRRAARDVGSGWLRGGFLNTDGDKCLVQGVLNSLALPGQQLPAHMVYEIDHQLSSYWYYRRLREVILQRGGTVQEAIMMWNDTPWRKKHQVVEVLDSLADDLELKWLREENQRLTSEVSALKSKIEEKEVRIKELEEQNGILKRLTNASTLREDRRQLQELSDELDVTWDKLQELPKIPA